MQEALNNPHFEKIRKAVIIKRHSEFYGYGLSLAFETLKDGCFVQLVKISTEKCEQKTDFKTFITKSKEYLDSIRLISCKGTMNSRFDAGTPDIEYHKAQNEIVTIVGRPITLFDVLNLLNPNKEDSIYVASSTEILQIPVGKFCDFTTNFLHEQTPETWETIAELI
jgi:hypothetical protein